MDYYIKRLLQVLGVALIFYTIIFAVFIGAADAFRIKGDMSRVYIKLGIGERLGEEQPVIFYSQYSHCSSQNCILFDEETGEREVLDCEGQKELYRELRAKYMNRIKANYYFEKQCGWCCPER